MKPFQSSGGNSAFAPNRIPGPRSCRYGHLWGWLVVCGLLSGCAAPAPWEIGTVKPCYHPNNVFQYTPVLPYDLKRVAVLPLACAGNRTDLQDGCESLDPVLQAELIKTKKFEVVPVSCDVLQSRTGQSTWTGAEILPLSFFDSLREVYGCDGVMFCQLTVFRAYAPLAVGLRMRLVDARTRQTLWATDEILDASGKKTSKQPGFDPFFEHFVTEDSLENWSIWNSPRQFGQFAAGQIVATLPGR
jgi:hypothetical protein